MQDLTPFAVTPEFFRPALIAFVVVIVGALILTLGKLALGVSQWRTQSPHRVGDRFGEATAEVVDWSGREGRVRIAGEIWRARSNADIAAGDTVKVSRVSGLTVEVRKA